MDLPKLYVVFYRPRDGNYRHWALYLDTNEDDIIYEVINSHPNFQPNVVHAKPERSGNFVKRIFVGMISNEDGARVGEVVKDTAVDNETLEWDCQEYMLDILERLKDEYILDEEDDDFKEAIDILKDERGPIVLKFVYIMRL